MKLVTELPVTSIEAEPEVDTVTVDKDETPSDLPVLGCIHTNENKVS